MSPFCRSNENVFKMPMLECSLYGVASSTVDYSNEYKHRRYTRVEHIYKRGDTHIYVHVDEDRKKHRLIYYSKVDRNKQRTCLALNMELFETNEDIFHVLEINKFTRISIMECEIEEFRISGYRVEINKENGSEEAMIKAYCYVDDVIEGEELLENVYTDLGIKMVYSTEMFMK
ncbi:hypothetical protein ECANGB1_1754 [Enterospora canceri]|uniref:CYTH domain-containing protein n=1 Tax=Enterospora canceri TaxID=1081671 RepID=A0A1Y1S5J9_9MICR|nr:hypothetical protein ECANGB1_1754 [Enterospora canceri]